LNGHCSDLLCIPAVADTASSFEFGREGNSMIFVTVPSASGAKYEAQSSSGARRAGAGLRLRRDFGGLKFRLSARKFSDGFARGANAHISESRHGDPFWGVP